MDPKALASLDPKLRETYEKVMGTSTAPSARPAGSAPAAPPARPASAPPIPPPVSPSMPNIPPPANPLTAQSNPILSASPINNQSGGTQSPLQAQNFGGLQPTPTGMPLPSTQASPVQLGKPIQPLPSPASINKSAPPSSSSSPLIRVLYILASIIFFAVYTIFWLKILKYDIKIPFLPF